MQKIGFEDAVDLIVREDPRFKKGAYFFLRDSLDHTVKSLGKSRKTEGDRHVSGRELLAGFRVYAIEQFGPMTMTVFEQWGLSKCSDVGEMVFNLIEAGVFSGSEQDRIEDFQGGYDFHDAFVTPYLPRKALQNA